MASEPLLIGCGLLTFIVAAPAGDCAPSNARPATKANNTRALIIFLLASEAVGVASA